MYIDLIKIAALFGQSRRTRVHLFIISGVFILTAMPVMAATYALGTSALLEGPASGFDSVTLAVAPETGTWTATTNVPWLHLSAINKSGTGSTNVVFTFDANPGATRTGILTVAGQTVTITQAGATYAIAKPVVTLVGSGLSTPFGVAVDNTGNVYISDSGHNAIKVWNAVSNSVFTLVSGLNNPQSVAVDTSNNVYFADFQTIKRWNIANNTVSTLVASFHGFDPIGVGLDGARNVYFSDFVPGGGTIYKVTLTNLAINPVVSSGLSGPTGLSVDIGTNVYIADGFHNALKKWTAASGVVSTLATNLNYPQSATVDGSGNVYIADTNTVKKWTAATANVTIPVSSGLNQPGAVAVDTAGNVYIADTMNNAIKELPFTFVDTTARSESAAAGNDALPPVLPATVNLNPPFAPTSDQSWLTISGASNGVVSFSFTANTSTTNRIAHISLLGKLITITQRVVVVPPMLTGPKILTNGAFQFSFTNNSNGAFSILTTTNLSLPLSNWTVLGAPSNVTPTLFQYTAGPTNDVKRYYTVRSP